MSDLPISREDMAELMRLARSDAGKRLLAYMKQQNGPELRAAADQAAAGNYDAARQIAGRLLSSAEAQELLRQLGR